MAFSWMTSNGQWVNLDGKVLDLQIRKRAAPTTGTPSNEVITEVGCQPILQANEEYAVAGRNLQLDFQSHPHSERRRNSATALLKLVLANKDAPDVMEEHVGRLLGELVWKLTEADGKYATKYKTTGAINCSDKSQLRHEHVYQRAKMIDALLNGQTHEVDGILNDAIGCTVTIDEHRRLENCDHEYGWERYRKAGLQVVDTATGFGQSEPIEPQSKLMDLISGSFPKRLFPGISIHHASTAGGTPKFMNR